MTDWTPAIVQAVYVFLIAYAIVTDTTSLRVPNWIPLSLGGLYVGYAMLTASFDQLALHVLIGAGALAVGFGLFSLGAFGGGDAKFLTALALWMGPASIGAFVVLATLFGGVMAAMLVGLKKLLIANPALASRTVIAKPVAWARDGRMPYALPLGLAALFLGPRVF